MSNPDTETLITEKEKHDREDDPRMVLQSLSLVDLDQLLEQAQKETCDAAQEIGKLQVYAELHGNSEQLLGAWIILESCLSKLLRLVYSRPSKTIVSEINVLCGLKRLFTSEESRHEETKKTVLAALDDNQIDKDVFIKRLCEIVWLTSTFADGFKSEYTKDDNEGIVENMWIYQAPTLNENDKMYIDILNQCI